MLRTFLRAKIHGARVTGADLNYEGSILLGRELMEAADFLPGEQVEIYNINNGERFQTYVLEPTGNMGDVILNGAAARKVAVGDPVIICAYAGVDLAREAVPAPKVVLVQDEKNTFRLKGA